MSVKGVEKKFKKLSWNHLENWAGSRILSRGENYFKNGKVSKLRITPKGLLARVSGGEQYVTLVAIKGSDRSVEINSECTCPYGFDCKHAVATVLAYSQAVKEGQDVLSLNQQTRIFKELRQTTTKRRRKYLRKWKMILSLRFNQLLKKR